MGRRPVSKGSPLPVQRLQRRALGRLSHLTELRRGGAKKPTRTAEEVAQNQFCTERTKGALSARWITR